MKQKIIFIVSLLILAAFSNPAAAANYYVTQDGAGIRNGSSPTNAWALSDFHNTNHWSSVAGTSGKISPGDVVYFSGTFTDGVIVTRGGSSAGSITLDGWEGGDCAPLKAVCTGSALLSQGMDVGNTIAGPDYLIIQDFRMTRNNSVNPGFRFYGNRNGTDAEQHIEHSIVRRNYVYRTNVTMFYWFGGRYNIIEGNKFTHFGQNGTNATQGVNIIRLHNSVIRGNEFGHDEKTYPSGCSSAEMVELHGVHNLLIEYNNIWGAPNQSGIRPKEHSGLDSRNIVIRFNRVHNSLSPVSGKGIHAYTNYNHGSNDRILNIYIYGNYIHNNSMYGILVGRGLEGGAYVWSNILSNNGRHGISHWSTSQVALHIYNNTFVRNNTRNETEHARGGIVITNNASGGINIKNNILWNNRPAGAGGKYNQIYSGFTLSSLEHNRYYHNLAEPTIYYAGAYRALATIKSVYGFENAPPAGEIVNPLFINPGGSDGIHGTIDDNYRLSAPSPLINQGRSLSGSFSVNLSGGDAWFINQTGYGTLTFGFDDALCPIRTNWTTNPPTVFTTKQSAHGSGWEPGAYVYTTSITEVCGDSICTSMETCLNCPQDCGDCSDWDDGDGGGGGYWDEATIAAAEEFFAKVDEFSQTADDRGGSCKDPAFISWISDSTDAAENQVLKLDQRHKFLSYLLDEGNRVRGILGEGVDRFDEFLNNNTPFAQGPGSNEDILGAGYIDPDRERIVRWSEGILRDDSGTIIPGNVYEANEVDSPAELLIKMRETHDPKDLASVLVYVWRGEELDPESPRMVSGVETTMGYVHAVKVEVRAPKRCNAACGTDRWPWIKTKTRRMRTKRCYYLRDYMGMVKARVIRYDEPTESGGWIGRFGNNVPIWKMQTAHPDSKGAGGPGGIFTVNSDCYRQILPAVRVIGEEVASYAGAPKYLHHAFMLNKVPNVPPANAYDRCWQVVHQNMLEHGVNSESCARYLWEGDDMGVRFTPCDAGFLTGTN